MGKQQWHVCGLFVQVRPAFTEKVKIMLLDMMPCTVPADDVALGKLVVVLESGDAAVLLEYIEAIRNIIGVLAVSLVYHQQDEACEETV